MLEFFLRVIYYIALLRFPPGTPYTTIIEQRYGRQVLKQVRKLEGICIKSNTLEWQIKYLHQCKTYELIPNFLKFKLYRRNLQTTEHYLSYQRYLLDKEIKFKENELNKKDSYRKHLSSNIEKTVFWLDFLYLKYTLNVNVTKSNNKTKDRLNKKLEKLGVNQSKFIKPDDIIFNHSNITLNNQQKAILALGLDYSIPPQNINKPKHYFSFEYIITTLKNDTPYKTTKEEVFKAISDIANWSYKTYKKWKHVIPKHSIKKHLGNLFKNPNLIITRPDKGKGVVILNKKDYIEKVEKIINDTTKFKNRENLEPIKLMQQLMLKLNNFLQHLLKKSIITQKTYKDLYASHGSPGILYGLPKIHKPNIPIRPIISSIGSFNRKLAQYLVPILNPIAINQYTVSKTSDFVDDLKQLHYQHDVYMASLDVTSLFTNVPLDETVDICTNSLCNNQESTYMDMDKATVKKMLNLAVKDNYFYFNGKLFEQIEGCSMGNSLAPTLANCFMAHHESKWLSSCPENFKPIFYRRYVDDIFVIFKTKKQAKQFHNYFNQQHNSINFTLEEGTDDSFNFLDITIKINNGKFILSTYRKPTFTGLGLSYTSFIPKIYKINSISTLLNRAYINCSNWTNLHIEIENLIQYFTQNRYPLKIVQRTIKRFIYSKMVTPTRIQTVEKSSKYICLPYYGTHSDETKLKLKQILSNAYPHIQFHIIFKNPFKLHMMFPFKDKVPLPLRSCVIYKFICECNLRYLGSTKAILHSRMSQHIGISDRTGIPTQKKLKSSIREHCSANDHQLTYDNFTIVASESNEEKLRLLESVYIKLEKPELNVQLDSEKLYTL